MKIGIMSDIHGDLSMLLRALDFFKDQDIDEILCAGDLVEKGDHGNEVVNILQKLHIPCVLGNHDEAAPTNQRWFREHLDISHPHIVDRLLTDETIAYLEKLPRTLTFEWENKRLLLAHGTPFSNMDYLHHFNPAETYFDIVDKAMADIIIVGHTHNPMKAFVDDVLIVNPGCLTSLQGRSTVGILSLPDRWFEVFNVMSGENIQSEPSAINASNDDTG